MAASVIGLRLSSRVERILCFCLAAAPLIVQARPAAAQVGSDSATVRLKVHAEMKPIRDVNVRTAAARATHTNTLGEATLRLPPGAHAIILNRFGFRPESLTVTLRAASDTSIAVELHDQTADLESIVVSATRGARRVEEEPTRVEVLDHDEVQEKTLMSPSGVGHLLSEAGGVRVAQTSPAFGSANIRVQGMRGRYTQLFADGLPLFGLSTEGIGLLQIPPIDLDHVELIKGAASALYGPTALGGVVNLVSRRPEEGAPTHQILLNQTSANATDAIYYGSRNVSERLGYTLLASGHRQSRSDLNGDRWADLPAYDRVLVRPRLFWSGQTGNSLYLTSGMTAENRSGGGEVPSGRNFAQDRATRRVDIGGIGRLLVGADKLLTLRSSATADWQRHRFGGALSRYRRTALFGEATIAVTRRLHNVVVGAAIQNDALVSNDLPAVEYTFTAPGAFAQHTWTPSNWLGLTSSARVDAHNEYGTFFSPRVSLLVRPMDGWTARLSAGGGEYAPTPFVEETEEIGLRTMRSFPRTGSASLRAERARSLSADVGGLLGPIEVIGSVYTSVIRDAVALRDLLGDSVELENLPEPTRTRGAEFVAIYRLGHTRLTGTYAFLEATEWDVNLGARRRVPLTARHSVGFMGMWEPKEASGVGVEAFYTGRQPLSENPYRTDSRPFVTVGALARWRFGRTVLFINSENLAGVRQTRFDPLLRPSPGIGGRWTVDAWAPLEGRVVNAGMQIHLGALHEEEEEEHERRLGDRRRS